jgi:hypothetical protein
VADESATPSRKSEYEFSTEFQCTGIPCTGDLTELAAAITGVQSVRLEVVQCVERLEAKLETRGFSDGKRLVQRSREVLPARAKNRILPRVAEAQVRAS